MKSPSNPWIVLATFLSIWVHVTVVDGHNFENFLNRLEREIEMKCWTMLPFSVTDDVIYALKHTSDQFKQNCVYYDIWAMKPRKWSITPDVALFKAYTEFFQDYKTSAADYTHKLNEIELVDPIGFIALLTADDVESPSELVPYIDKYYEKISSLKLDDRFRVLALSGKLSEMIDLLYRHCEPPPKLEPPPISRKQPELDDVCSICRESIYEKSEDDLCYLPCGHTGCKECFGTWLNEKLECPQCRAQLRRTCKPNRYKLKN